VKEEMAVQDPGEAQMVAVGASPIHSGTSRAMAEEKVAGGLAGVADEIVARVETMSVGWKMDKDEVIDNKRVVRLPGERNRRIVETGEGDRIGIEEERGLVRAIPVTPRSGVQGMGVGRRVPSRLSNLSISRREGMGRGQGG